MKKIIIPPCVTSRKAFNFGQAINFVYADVIARSFRAQGESVEFTPFTWNNHARRTEELNPHLTSYDTHLNACNDRIDYLEDMLSKINILHSDGRYKDSNDHEKQKVNESLHKLHELGYIAVKGGDLYLDLPRIVEETSVGEYIDQINFTPSRFKGLVKHNLKHSDPFLLTQEAIFATDIEGPLAKVVGSNKKIKPVFNLFFSPYFLSDNFVDYIVNGECSTTRYVYDGLAIHAALRGEKFTSNVLTYPYVKFEEGTADVEDLLNKWEDPNILRFATLQYVNKNERSDFSDQPFKRGYKLIKKITNLRNLFEELPQEPELDGTILKQIAEGKVNNATQTLEKRVKSLSSDVTLRRKDNKSVGFQDLTDSFASLYKTAEIFFPNISEYKINP